MKRKMLLLGSFGAMFLSAALLFTPSGVSAIVHRCTTCSNVTKTSACAPLTADSCICPLTPPFKTNNCF